MDIYYNYLETPQAQNMQETEIPTDLQSALKKPKEMIVAYAKENRQMRRKEVENLLEAGTTKA